MHELGVLRHIARTVSRVAEEHCVKIVKYITLEVGSESGFVELYLRKLFPILQDAYAVLKKAELRISVIQGRGLLIKEIGY